MSRGTLDSVMDLELRVRGYHPLRQWLSNHSSARSQSSIIRSEPRLYYYNRFRLFRVRSPLLAESHFVFSSWGYLDVSVPPVSLHHAMDLRNDDSTLLLPGFPIRKSADHWLFAPTRSLSQLVTSFIVSQCQGILPALLVA